MSNKEVPDGSKCHPLEMMMTFADSCQNYDLILLALPGSLSKSRDSKKQSNTHHSADQENDM